MHINEITYEQIDLLTAEQLTELLFKLLRLEYLKYNFSDCEIFVPQKINVGDGGEDGRIKCNNTKESIWIKNKDSLFQCKAYNLTPQKCYEEMLNKKKKLNSQLEEIFNTMVRGKIRL